MEQNALEKLKAIGIEKIKEATNIDTGKIEDILEKRFEKIDLVRARGFIHIIEKEYKINLSSWLDEYAQYQLQSGGDKRSQENKRLDNAHQGNVKIWFACMLLFIFGGGILYWIYLQDNKASIKELPQVGNKIQNIEQDVKKIDENTEQEPVINNEDKLEEHIQSPINTPIPQIQIEKKALSEYGEEIFPTLTYNEENILFLTSDTPLWVGIINLDTKKRVAKIKKEFEIPLDKQLLINIARGGFSVSLDDEEKVFGGYKPIYLIHTKEGGLKEITKEEFVLLNGGVEW